MFYKTGIDITNDKQMFNFLKNHFTYVTLGNWNRLCSIANIVKLYHLNLSGDWCNTLRLLEAGEYETLRYMIQDWEAEHPGYEVYFNGRSSGYLVLKDKEHNGTILPYVIDEAEDYDEYKRYCKEYYGSVKANRNELVTLTKLVQDFDKLCDELRDYCDELSKTSFEVVTMEKSVSMFNEQYEDDLELLGFMKLVCNEEGKVDVKELITLTCLFEAFCRIADRSNCGYSLKSDENGFIQYVKK